MKKERCSWCGQVIQLGQGAKSNNKYYHTHCLVARNMASKSTKTDYELDNALPYEPITRTLEMRKSSDELLTSINSNWKQAAKESRMRILAKFGTGINR